MEIFLYYSVNGKVHLICVIFTTSSMKSKIGKCMQILLIGMLQIVEEAFSTCTRLCTMSK